MLIGEGSGSASFATFWRLLPPLSPRDAMAESSVYAQQAAAPCCIAAGW